MKSLAFAAIAVALGAVSPAHAERGSSRHHYSDTRHHSGAKSCDYGKSRKGCVQRSYTRKYRVGHRFNHRFGGYTPYHKIPRNLRARYRLSPRGRYVYDGHYIYRVDPTTLAVSQVLTAVFR